MDSEREQVRAFLRELRAPAERKWRSSGGHAAERIAASDDAVTVYREACILQLMALALDAENSKLTDCIRARNAVATRGVGSLGEARPRPKAVEGDDYTDGSALQARLVEANVRDDKPTVALASGVHVVTGARGRATRRAVVDRFAEPDECAMVAAAAVAALAGGFSRCGQSTLGISPALAQRLSPAAAAEAGATPRAMQLLYELVERARRRVASEFGVQAELHVSDAQVARLQPVAHAPHARADGLPSHDAWDVGLARADTFSYWRPHVDQESVRSYEYSALLYLDEHGEDFEGGRLVLHDVDVDHVVEPHAGRLLLFESGADNVHAVQRVLAGTRFAITMWFTTSARDKQPDKEQGEWQAWARASVEAKQASGAAAADVAPPPPPPPPPQPAASRRAVPTRLDTLRLSALCTLPAGDPLCRELLCAAPGGAVSVEVLLAEGMGYDPTAACDWHELTLVPRDGAGARDGADESEGMSTDVGVRLPAAEEWLHARIEACAALLRTLHSAPAGVHVDGAAAAVESLPAKKARAQVHEAFSVFD